jgi:TP901 family phage tail tape measure protein
MATLAGRAYIDVAYDPGSIQKLRATTAAEGQRISSTFDKTASKFKSVGASLTRNVTLPLVAVGAVSVKVAADFDASLSKIQGLVGASTQQMAVYRKSILALAPAVAQGPTALADALYFVTSSGFKGAQALKILAVSAKASTAGLGDTKTVADLVTSAMTAYGSKTLTAAHATDILVAATKAGKGEPGQFAAALQENVAAANTLGVSFSQLAAATAALSTVNSNVSQDATQLSGIFQAIIKPGPEAIKTLKQVGLSVADLRKEVKDKGLLNTLLDLKNRFHGNVTEMGKLFPNVRGLRGFLTLVGSAAKRNVSIFDQVAHSTGDLNKAFKTALTSNPQVQFKKLTAQLQVMAIIIGEALIPVLLKLAGYVTSLAGKFKGLSSGQQTFVLITAGILAAIGPVISLATNLAIMGKAIYAVAKATFLWAKAQFVLDGALALNPIGIAIIAVVALAAAIVIAYKRSATFRGIVLSAMHAAAAAVDFVRAHWQAFFPVIAALGNLVSQAASHFDTFKKLGVAAFDAVKSAVHPVTSAIQTLVSWIESLISQIARIHWPSPPSWLKDALGAGLKSIVPGGGVISHTGGIVGPHAMRGYAAGGMVVGGIAGRDSVPALLTPGEIVLNEKQQRALLHGMRGMAGDVYVTVLLDGKPVRAMVKAEQAGTARRVKAGTRYG